MDDIFKRLSTGQVSKNILSDTFGNDTNITESGIANFSSLKIGNVEVIDSSRNLTNITSSGLTFTDLDVGNINITANTISSTNTNGNIALSPNGTGIITGNDLTCTGDVTAEYIRTNGMFLYENTMESATYLNFQSVNSTAFFSDCRVMSSFGFFASGVDNTGPNLNSNGLSNANDLLINTTANNGDITLTTHGTGKVIAANIDITTSQIYTADSLVIQCDTDDISLKALNGDVFIEGNSRLGLLTNDIFGVGDISGTAMTIESTAGNLTLASSANIALTSNLDMNSNDITNVGNITTTGALTVQMPDSGQNLPIGLLVENTTTTGGADLDASIMVLSKEQGESNIFLSNNDSGYRTWNISLDPISTGLSFFYDAVDPRSTTVGNEKMSLSSSGDLTVNGSISGTRMIYPYINVEKTNGTSGQIDVSNSSIVSLSATGSGTFTVNNFTGGVNGQIVHLLCSSSGDNMIIKHNNSTGTGAQVILNSTGADITIAGYGMIVFVCSGTFWFSGTGV